MLVALLHALNAKLDAHGLFLGSTDQDQAIPSTLGLPSALHLSGHYHNCAEKLNFHITAYDNFTRARFDHTWYTYNNSRLHREEDRYTTCTSSTEDLRAFFRCAVDLNLELTTTLDNYFGDNNEPVMKVTIDGHAPFFLTFVE